MAVAVVVTVQTIGCSVFPESAPAVSGPTAAGGAGGGDGAGGRTSGSGGTANDGGAGGGGSGGLTGTGGAAGAHDASTSGGSNGGRPGDAAIVSDDAAPLEVDYVAAVVDCLEEVSGTNPPNPDACLAYAGGKDGPNEVWIDLKKGSHRAFTGYLRFDVDDKLAGRTLLDARVEVTVTTYATAAGNSPALWECAPFTRASLFVQAPALIGAAFIDPSQGIVSPSETVSYRLPSSLVAPSTAVYLALVPEVANGSGYWNLMGPKPPRLVVTYR
jgi:hypothetical protein